MKSVSRVIAVVVIACGMMVVHARAEENHQQPVRELNQAPKLNLGKGTWDGHPQIRRIKTAAAFKKMGGQKGFGFDFGSHDLVVVCGALGCAHGKVQFTTDKETVTFSVKITERCNHLTKELHWFSYSSAFAVAKKVVITPSVFVTGKTEKGEKADLSEKLKNTETTHLNLSSLGVTDEDLVKLKEFKNLTHLYLHNNQITDQGLANLSHLTKLYELYLGDNAGITDAGLVHLKDIMTSRIQILGIEGTRITQDGLKQLNQWVAQQKDEFSTQINHSLVTPQIHE